MDIQLLGAWGEFIGGISSLVSAVAVIGSLIFVGLQLRQHTRAIRSAARSEIALNQVDGNFRLAENPKLMESAYALLKGEKLSQQELLVGAQVLSGEFRGFENQFFAYKEGNFPESVWQGYKQNIVWNVNQVNFGGFWDGRRSLFSTEFVAFVDELASRG
jgi:hypothetical protein